jgi:hypothetical protein
MKVTSWTSSSDTSIKYRSDGRSQSAERERVDIHSVTLGDEPDNDVFAIRNLSPHETLKRAKFGSRGHLKGSGDFCGNSKVTDKRRRRRFSSCFSTGSYSHAATSGSLVYHNDEPTTSSSGLQRGSSRYSCIRRT